MPNTENSIEADVKTIGEILTKLKYDIDVFQREYRWEEKQIVQLLADLESKFFLEYDEKHARKDVQNYSRYYMGSIIINLKNDKRLIIDGQQRLTSITLLLIYLHNLQKRSEQKVNIEDMIFSEKFGEKSYNLDIEDRRECIDTLYNNKDNENEYKPNNKEESVQNIIQRYEDIKQFFPKEIIGKPLPYFIDWLIEKVVFVEIKTHSDENAYMIFETMNDRGLNLTPTEMLKGYLLSNLGTEEDKKKLNLFWKERIAKLKEIENDEDREFFRAWLRAKYAETIRRRKKGAENEDFEKIAHRFHSWVRDNKNTLGLDTATGFHNFIHIQFDFFSKLYLQIHNATKTLDNNLEYVFYVHNIKFPRSFYSALIMSPIKNNDDEEIIEKKIAIVSRFLETFIVYRAVNSKTLSYSSIRYTMFSLIKEIRNMDIPELINILKSKINKFDIKLNGIMNFKLNQLNKRYVHFILARITNHVEKKCHIHSNFRNYIEKDSKNPFEIEHIWANKFDKHADEFDTEQDFKDFRNKIGGLILVQKNFNSSYGSNTYEEKIDQYFGQNMLAKSLNQKCYKNNPAFMKYKEKSNLPFKPHSHFKKSDLEERQKLYQKICEEVWSLDGFDEIQNR